MASFDSGKIHLDITKRSLKYNKCIKKIPEYWKVDEKDYPLLPCSDIYSLVVVYDNLFKILSILYNRKNVHKDVLNHIKYNHKYYKSVANNYLRLKKLELVDWLAGMLTKDLPADEICIHACGVFLQ